MTGWGRARIQKKAAEGNDLHGDHGRVCEGDRARVGVSHGMVQCSETSAYKIQKTGVCPEESIQHNCCYFICRRFGTLSVPSSLAGRYEE